jgi:hypothetical protein
MMGPQYHEGDLSRPFRGTRGARPSHVIVSPIVALKHERQPPPCRETRSAEGVQDPDPQYCREDLSRPSTGDTWRMIKPPRRFAHRDFKVQRAASLLRDARGAESIQGPGPQQHEKDSEPSDLEGCVALD